MKMTVDSSIEGRINIFIGLRDVVKISIKF